MRLRRLLERCIAGEHAAWEEFAKQYGRLLEFSAKKRLSQFGIRLDEEQSERIVQDILIHLWEGKKLAQVRDQDRIAAWLAAVAGNTAISCWRKQHCEMDRRTQSLSKNLTPGEAKEVFLEAMLVAEGPSPREELENRERDQELQKTLSRLSPREQLVLKAAYFLNQTHEEIGRMLGVPRNTVSTALSRAKEKLRQFLEKEMKEKTESERLYE